MKVGGTNWRVSFTNQWIAGDNFMGCFCTTIIMVYYRRGLFQFSVRWNFRCPDPQNPCSVLYNQDIDRLEAVNDSDESTNTEDGPVSLSGIVIDDTLVEVVTNIVRV